MTTPPRKPPPPSGLRRLLHAHVDRASSGFAGCAFATLVAVGLCGGIVCGALMIFAIAVRIFSGAY